MAASLARRIDSVKDAEHRALSQFENPLFNRGTMSATEGASPLQKVMQPSVVTNGRQDENREVDEES